MQKKIKDDTIYRQDAIDALDALCDRECEYSKKQRSFMCGSCHLGSAIDVIERVPSVQPKTHEKRTEMHACDCISRQWLIECVSERLIKFDTEMDENRFIHLVRDMAPSVQPEPKWIPCSERLPEDGTDILVTYVDEEETRIIPVNYGRGTWFDCIFDRALDSLKVTAWMPLLEPYNEDRK